jgi:predicted O-linked N-acetylglucosamine transferase (SPINDLY family)
LSKEETEPLAHPVNNVREEAYQNALMLHENGKLSEAETAYQEFIKNAPDHLGALLGLGKIALQSGKTEQALDIFAQVVNRHPNDATGLYYLAWAETKLNRFSSALSSFDRIIAVEPNNVRAHRERGWVLFQMRQYEDALRSFDTAITLDSGDLVAHLHRGSVLFSMNRYEDALACFDIAITIKPNNALAHRNRGITLKKLKRYEEAIASLKTAKALDPEFELLFADILRLKTLICAFLEAEDYDQIRAITTQGKVCCDPFVMLCLLDDPAVQKKAAEIWVEKKLRVESKPYTVVKNPAHNKIRLGYFSADYRNHAMMYLITELFEKHDRSKFELIGLSLGASNADEMRMRAVRYFDKFIDVSGETDKEIASISRNLEIDVAIDLSGFTNGGRPGIFGYRAAPVQVNYLGYPGTMGAKFMDYIIADQTLVPDVDTHYYAESIAFLPNSYMVSSCKFNETWLGASGKCPSREQLHLPSEAFVFACFNNQSKITASFFASWMRILKRVDNSVLWLLVDNDSARCNLTRAAVAHGVEPERLIFAERLPLNEHLLRHQAADLFLDTSPYNSHTTAVDALWMGLPLLTFPGKTFAARVSASLLNALSLPELIAKDQEEYEDRAVRFGADPDEIRTLKQKLLINRETTPLFDTKLFAKHIENAFQQMYKRCQSGLSPCNIYASESS